MPKAKNTVGSWVRQGRNASTTEGRVGQTNPDGTFRGSRQGFSESRGGQVSNNGKLITRRQQYGQIRRGLGLAGG